MDMRAVRQVRAVTRVMGRRTALRYLAVGLGASVLAACGKSADGTGGGGAASGSAGGSGPLEQAFSAFVRGTWKVVVEPAGNGTAAVLTAEITASSWTLTMGGGQDSPWGGQWALMGDTLAIHGPESPQDPDELVQVAALGVPARVGRSASLVLPWRPPGDTSAGAGQNLQVEYAKGTLRIVHVDGDSRTVFTCTRG